MSKGAWIFIGLLIASAIFCYWVPFSLLPNNGIAMALPVITVPGENLCKDCFGISGLRLTNTIVGTLLADVAVLLFAFGATRRLKEVPGRLQGLFEMLTDALYGLAKTTAGPVWAKRIFPLMATIFLFLLFANWLELVPGVDSVGLIHCAEPGMSGYDTHEVMGITVLKNEEILNSGDKATEADAEACEAHHEGTSAEHEGADAEHEGEAAGRDNIQIVTPFIRAAATDLNLTIGLGLIAVLVIQYFGVRSLGVGYFAKWINFPWVDKLDKQPMGVLDFAVGFLDIIGELSRIVSFGFRLFGNIFAGQVLLFVIPFLAGALIPFFIYGFELFVGAIQAFVFAMLFLVFAAMATAGHGDHEEGH